MGFAKQVPVYADIPLNVNEMVRHLLLIQNEIYRIERDVSGYVFFFATPEISKFIYDKVMTQQP